MTRRGAGPVAAVGTGLLALALALGIHASGSAAVSGHPAAVPSVDRGSVPSAQPVPTPRGRTAGPATARATAPATVAAGSRLRYPRLHVDARIVPTTVRHGVMQVPLDPATVGWWRAGAPAGAPRGSVVVVGHVNYAGRAGALANLPGARPGDAIRIVEPGGVAVGYRVTGVRTYAKTAGIPASAFATVGPAQLVLITCGGPFDPVTGSYLDNVVAYATPL